jgi:3-hydroxyisobutyrate dehydrogenase-like beta-hydroxyacid dehydrogenase
VPPAKKLNESSISGIAMKIGFLGLGNMGTPMALRLLAAGHELSVWNRSEERTKPLIHEGAIAAATPAEAELGSDAVITMLLDDAAYEEVLFGVHSFINVLSPGGLHILCGTINMALGERLAVEHAKRGVDFVIAPVFGTATDAEDGRLWIVAAGADQAVERARPLLEALSRGITVVGKEPQEAYIHSCSIESGDRRSTSTHESK